MAEICVEYICQIWVREPILSAIAELNGVKAQTHPILSEGCLIWVKKTSKISQLKQWWQCLWLYTPKLNSRNSIEDVKYDSPMLKRWSFPPCVSRALPLIPRSSKQNFSSTTRGTTGVLLAVARYTFEYGDKIQRILRLEDGYQSSADQVFILPIIWRQDQAAWGALAVSDGDMNNRVSSTSSHI